MSEQLAIAGPKASDQLATFLGIEKGMMLETLKAQCFKGKRPDEVSDAQLAAFVSTANVLQVNPLVPGMLYAYPERNGGITPILGPDGVFKKLDEFIATGKLAGFECEVFNGPDGKPERAEAMIFRGGDAKPAKYTAWFSEWCVTSNPNWAARPRHMLWVRAIKQCARQVIHGLPMDSDEYEIAQMHNVTPEPVVRPEPPKKSTRGAAAVKENAAKEVVAEVETVATAPVSAPVSAPIEVVEPTPAPKVETPKPAPKPVEKVAPKAAATQRASLQDKEILTVTAKISEFKTLDITKGGIVHPSVVGALESADFKGSVFHLNGATLKDGKKEPVAAWQLEQPVTVTLRGEFSAKQNRVVSWVESIALPEEPAASQQVTEDV